MLMNSPNVTLKGKQTNSGETLAPIFITSRVTGGGGNTVTPGNFSNSARNAIRLQPIEGKLINLPIRISPFYLL
ncbi:MAG: hypothetical protein DRO88_02910 [Promethearchaeia archaeon]|nr:MAG: hypothetical protein DRO88_02910 [Candidatus Lokiarchaeia archaeon]